MNWESVTERINQHVVETGLPALVIGVVQAGELTHCKSFGHLLNGDLSKQAAQIQFPICSTAKPLTATLIMTLIEDGLLSLDTPVIDHLPRLIYPAGGDASQVTVRHLLTHTSGLSSDPDIPDRFFVDGDAALATHVYEDVPGYRALPPGQVLWYSNPGFNVLGYLAEQRTQVPFARLIRERVLEPLEMTRTTFDASDSAAANAVAKLLGESAKRSPPIVYPAGGGVSTVGDLAQFAGMQMSGNHLLNGDTLELMHRVHADAYTRPPRYYGLGFDIEYHNGHKLVTHGGGGFGCGTAFVMVPAQQVAFIALFNHWGGYGLQIHAILDELVKDAGDAEAPDDPMTQLPIARFVSMWPEADDYPDEIEVVGSTEVRIGDEVHRLTAVANSVYQTADGKMTFGILRDGNHLMYDGFGIGLVTAMPYRRQAG